MSRSEDFFSRDSRFDAWWGGPYDPEALEYARTHEGVNFNHPGTENTDLNAVRRYNIASNQGRLCGFYQHLGLSLALPREPNIRFQKPKDFTRKIQNTSREQTDF